MLPKILTLKLGDESFRLRWDMHAIGTLERLTGTNGLEGIIVNVSNMTAVLWSALDAYAASRDEDAPISYRRFGTLIDTEDKIKHAFEVGTELLQLNAPEESKPSGKGGKAAKHSRSDAATKSGS